MSFTLPIELRPLRSILSRIADQHPDSPVGQAVSDWCAREGVAVPADMRARAAASQLADVFMERARKQLTWPAASTLSL